jgi:hypothetical protein
VRAYCGAEAITLAQRLRPVRFIAEVRRALLPH